MLPHFQLAWCIHVRMLDRSVYLQFCLSLISIDSDCWWRLLNYTMVPWETIVRPERGWYSSLVAISMVDHFLILHSSSLLHSCFVCERLPSFNNRSPPIPNRIGHVLTSQSPTALRSDVNAPVGKRSSSGRLCRAAVRVCCPNNHVLLSPSTGWYCMELPLRSRFRFQSI